GYVPATHRDYERRMQELDANLKDLAANNITVLLMVGAGPGEQPLGRPRPHLNDNDVMLPTKTDMAWLPSLDADFQQWVAELAGKYGWPNGPVTAFSLWNEPWEGLSISGWGADMPRYREIYTAMAKGVVQARDAAKVDVLIAGCDSSSNTWDKLFGDGTDTFLPWLDACTIHYQGMMPPIGYKLWERPGNPHGRVKIWDTESWVANTDDRVAAVIATNRAAGYDRSMGVFHGNICESVRFVKQVKDGKPERIETVQAYSVACAIGAAQHFIGERNFRELLFKKGLPWVMLFDGLNGNPDDGTIVVVGDIGEAFGAQNVLFRTVRGLKETAEKEAIRAKLAALPTDSPDRAKLEADLRAYGVLSDASLTLPDGGGAFSLFDFYGNPVLSRTTWRTLRGLSKGGAIVVPLDSRGFFLRPSGEKGSFDKLVAAVRAAHIEGYEPVEVIVHDVLAPIESKPSLRLEMTNMLNRPIEGALSVKLGGLQVQAPPRLSLAPHETKNVEVKITGGAAAPSNTYPLSLAFDAGKDGKAVHYEDTHVNLIARRTVNVDGKLDDWEGVLPQTVRADEKAALSLTESAWFPFKQFDDSIDKGLANGYLAYDDKFFYFAAKVADSSPDDGTCRFETRNDDEFYYPEVCYNVDMANSYMKVEAKFDAKENSPQLPEGDGRSTAVWENDKLVRAFAIDLDLPSDRVTQVAFYFPPYDMHPNGFRVRVFDREKNRQ
ncbi:MAG TPA: hypothetical protein VM487_17400, partial [Phycisphaerae bacterium]|nr:hypothetical protein [Phycisphaerae bacterium]